MKFSEIEEGVHQAWQFVVPPALYIFTLVLFTYYIAPGLLLDALAQLPLQRTFVIEDQQIRETLNFYGITKILPILAFIGAVFLLHVVRAIVLSAGHLLPGHVVILTQERFKHAAGPERLSMLWSVASTTESEDEAIRILLNKFESADATLRSTVQSWANEAGKQYQLLSAAKVCLLWTLVLPWIARANEVGVNYSAVWLFGTSSLLAGLYAIVRQVYAEEQFGYAQVDVIQRVIDAATPPLAPDENRTAAHRATLSEAAFRCDTAWWELRFVDVHFFRWFRRTFFSHRVRRHRKSIHLRQLAETASGVGPSPGAAGVQGRGAGSSPPERTGSTPSL